MELKLSGVARRLMGVSGRLGTFLYYLPLMLQVRSLSIWQRGGSRARAIALCERKRQRDPFAPVPYLFLVDLYIAEGEHARVAELCQDLALLGYSSPALVKKHAYALCHLEQFQAAIGVLEAALDTGEPDPWLLECVGNCYFTVAEYRLAREAYVRCLDLAVTAEVQRRVRDLVRQVDALLGYRHGEDEDL
jgi:tetratricopeptide (TPR) repeat protein